MLDRERYIRELEAAQKKKIEEYEKKLREKEKIAKELMDYARQIREAKNQK
jgi:hypothetical protein